MNPLPHFKIRRWQRGDEESLVRYADNYQIWRNVRDSFPHPYTWQHAQDWIALCESEQTPTVFAIEINGEAVGSVGIIPQKDIYCKNAEIGYWLAEPFWGRGIMTEALNEMCEYVFQNFAIRQIYACVFEYNVASMRVLEKAEFKRVAVQKKWLFKEGKFWDNHLFVRALNE